MERKEVIRKVLNLIVTVLTAIVTTLGTTSCVKNDLVPTRTAIVKTTPAQ